MKYKFEVLKFQGADSAERLAVCMDLYSQRGSVPCGGPFVIPNHPLHGTVTSTLCLLIQTPMEVEEEAPKVHPQVVLQATRVEPSLLNVALRLERTYVELLSLPEGPTKNRFSNTLAGIRDCIADALGKTAECVEGYWKDAIDKHPTKVGVWTLGRSIVNIVLVKEKE